MKKITPELIKMLEAKAVDDPRKRVNYDLHHPKDRLQRLINSMTRDSYAQPHKHESQDKTEIFSILSGKMLILEFDDSELQ